MRCRAIVARGRLDPIAIDPSSVASCATPASAIRTFDLHQRGDETSACERLLVGHPPRGGPDRQALVRALAPWGVDRVLERFGYQALAPTRPPPEGRRLRPRTAGTAPRPTPLYPRASPRCRAASRSRSTPDRRSGPPSEPSGPRRFALRARAPPRQVLAGLLVGLVDPTCDATDAPIGETLAPGLPYTPDEGHRAYLLPGPCSPSDGLVARSGAALF
jgi:hypothetical protein